MIVIPGLSAEDCSEVAGVLDRFATLHRVWLFGSRAKGTAKPGSDVDLAVEGFQGNLALLSDLRYQLNEASTLPYAFDVIDRSTITSPELNDHLNRVGQLIYERTASF